jgi:protein involved in polysaccharide export with SLBB domain
MPLQTGDVVRVFSTTEAQMLRDSMKRFRQYKALARNAARDPQGLTTQQTSADLLPSDSEFLNQLGFSQAATATNPPIGNATSTGTFLTPPGSVPTFMPPQAMTNPSGTSFGAYPAPSYPNGTGAGYPGAGYTNGATTNPNYQNYPNGASNYSSTSSNGSANPTAPYQGAANAGTANLQPNYPGRINGNPISPFNAYQNTQYGALAMPGASSPSVPQGVLSNVPPGNLQEQNISGSQVPTNEEAVTFVQAARQLSVEPTIFANFLLDHSVVLSGAVRGVGLYFAGPSLTLDTLIDAAGGTSSWADGSAIDVISTSLDRKTGTAATAHGTVRVEQVANYIVKPHDEFHVHEIYSDANFGSVTLQGEVRSAGDYQITRGERLSQLLARAGGLTDIAYPYGTIFLRRSAANVEAQGYQRAADEVQSQLIGAMTRVTTSATNRLSPNDFGALESFVAQLRMQKPLGRVSVIADPALLIAKPNLDPLLEPGDVIYVPQRPSTVTVLGQVLQPGSFPFEKHATVEDYLEAAGGYAQYADESTTFVVLPDGKAEKVEASWFSAGNQVLPPGSTIVVPRDLAPYDSRQLILDMTQIFSQLAVTAASLAILSNQ